MDIVGPLERAPYDCRFAITLVDYHSKWPEVCFTHAVTSEAVITFLSALFSREGFPEAIVTDNGPQFKSQIFETFLSDRGIQHLCSSNYDPQANGQVERFNRVLKEQMQLAQLECRPLKQAVTKYLGTYRFTPQATTGLSPAQLLHNRQPRSGIDIAGLHPKSSAPSPMLDPVRTRVFHRQQATKLRIDSKRGAKPPKLQVGHRVKVRLPGKQNKYKGPYTILSQIGLNSFRLSDGNVWNASKLVIVNAEQNAISQQNSRPPPDFSSRQQSNTSPPPCFSAAPQLVTLPLTTLQAPSQQSADVPSPNADLIEGGKDVSCTDTPESLPRLLSDDEHVGEPQGSNSSELDKAPSVNPSPHSPACLRPKRRRKKPARYKDFVP
uniref:Gypsy-11 cq-i n=1 Tax=Rhipicephalus zambeziensis TaxID=60191 RepID=A0A224YXR6_9ACAR